MLPPAPISSDVTISVVVSAYNYAHFLPACLDSLRAQTEPADEIIVVNDGSTDVTADILARETGITVINQENRGQAAAFNVGVAQSSGEAILFLDADDRLKPTALETLRRLWSDEVSCLCFDLEMVDRDGAPVGRYDMRVPQIDLLPRVLRDLAMPFMPTSGNVFRRAAVDWAFPLPEPRWKISADAVLIRIAAFAGPILHVPHTLGEYRVHRHNNWFKEFAAKNWRLQRGHMDIAQTGVELVRLADRANRQLHAGARLMLLFAIIRSQVKADELGEDDKGLTRALRYAMSAWPKTERPAIKALLLALRLVLPHSATMRNWVIDRPTRPRVIDELLARIIGTDLAQRMEVACLPRPPFSLKWDLPSAMDRPRLDAHFASRAWSRHWTGAWFDLCNDSGEIVFTRAGSEAVELNIDVEPPSTGGVVVSVKQAGILLELFHVHNRQTLSIQLLATDCVAPLPDRIELQVTQPNYNKSRWYKRKPKPSQRLRLHSFTLGVPTQEAPGAVLPVSDMRAFGDLLPSLTGEPLDDASDLAPDTPLVLARPPVNGPLTLLLQLGEAQTPGWVTLTLDTHVIHAGHVGPHDLIRAQVPDADLAPGATFHLHTGFEPDDATDAPQLAIDRMGWDHTAPETPDGVKRLAMGQWVGPHFNASERALLTEGWQFDEDGVPTFFASSAEITLAFEPSDKMGCVIELDLAPTDDRSEVDAPAVIVSVNGEQREALRIGGRHVVTVTLDAEAMRGDCVLGLHAAIIGSEAMPLPHGGLELHGIGVKSLELSESVARPYQAYEPRPARKLMLARLMDDDFEPPIDRDAFRTILTDEVNGLTSRALADYLTPEVLGRLSALGAEATVPAAMPSAEQPENGAEWLRWIGVAMLSGSGWKVAPELSLADLPVFDHAYAEQVGAWMGQPPTDEKDISTYERAMAPWLGEVRTALIGSHETSRKVLAGALLDAAVVAPTSDLARLFATAIEAKLLAEGQVLRLVAPPSNGGVGVLLKDAAALDEDQQAMIADLARDKDVTIFHCGAAVGLPEAVRQVDLSAFSFKLAVSDIRARTLDTMLIASPRDRCDLLTMVAAHQLAREQTDLMQGVAPAFSSTAARSPRYLFHHMPKTGGTSLRKMMERWFHVTPDYREWWGETAPEPLDLSQISPIGMLFGHFGTDHMPLNMRYPETSDPENWRRITFVRDPLEQAISWHGFEKVARAKHDPSFKPIPLDQHLMECDSIYLRHFECDETNWRAALDRYWFIGTQERFEESMTCLGHMLKRPLPETVRFHQTPKKDAPSPEAAAAFRQRRAVDFEIYQEIDARLTAKIDAS